jgi:hypothetical protein
MTRLLQLASVAALLFCAPAYAGPKTKVPAKSHAELAANYWEGRAVHYFRELIKAHARIVELESAQRRGQR